MIAQLTGVVTPSTTSEYLILDVQGVGYRIWVLPADTYTDGERVTVYTYLAVRENAMDLYGFRAHETLTMFEHLIKLPKIGPKTALNILAHADARTIVKAVVEKDAGYLSKVSGIGKKSAENIVSGLADILDVSYFEMSTHAPSSRDADVLEALITLGYSQKNALDALQNIPNDITDTNERIKQALKYIR